MSATLTFSSSNRTSVTFNYSTTMQKPTDTSEIRYGTPSYRWSFGRNGASGTYTWSGWSPGSREQISGVTVTMSGTTSVYTKVQDAQPEVPPEIGEDGKPVPGTGKPATDAKYEWKPGSGYSQTETANRLIFYTRPSSWSFNLPDYGWTDSWLTEDTWIDFVNKIEEYLSWENQEDTSVNNLNFPSDNHIGANLFNRAASLLGASVRVSNGERIRASLFDDLSSVLR